MNADRALTIAALTLAACAAVFTLVACIAMLLEAT